MGTTPPTPGVGSPGRAGPQTHRPPIPAENAPRRKRLTADARREQIIASARRVFVERGLAGARTRDLAAEARVTEALIYNHFGSKEELFEAAIAEPLERAVSALIELSGQPPEEFDVTSEVMYERTRAFVRDLLDVMQDVGPLLSSVLGGDSSNASRHYRTRIAPSLDAVVDVVRANLASWHHRDFDPELIVKLTFGTAWFLSLTDRLTGTRRDLDRVADLISEVIIYGLDSGRPETS